MATKKLTLGQLICHFGARDRNRTGTVSLPQDFKSCASTCSATRAMKWSLSGESNSRPLD